MGINHPHFKGRKKNTECVKNALSSLLITIQGTSYLRFIIYWDLCYWASGFVWKFQEIIFTLERLSVMNFYNMPQNLQEVNSKQSWNIYWGKELSLYLGLLAEKWWKYGTAMLIEDSSPYRCIAAVAYWGRNGK